MKDYAKSSCNRHKTTTKKKRWLTPIIILVAGLFPLTMYYFRYQNTIHNKGKVMTVNVQPEHEKTSKPTPLPVEPQYSFYTLLPKMAVNVSESSHPIPLSHKSKTSHYLLQIASVRHHQDAYRLRDHLQAIGYSAFTLKDTLPHHQHRYRVLTGPYESLELAEKDQRQLHRREKMDSLLLRINQQTK